MMEKTKIALMIILMATLTAIAFIGLGAMIGYQRGINDCKVQIIRDTIRETDTITVLEPRIDTIIKVVNRQYMVEVYDTVTNTVTDTVLVLLPRESSLYEIPDTLKVWYSGFDAAIDSAKVYDHTTVIKETKVIRDERSNTIAVSAGTRDASVTYLRNVGMMSFGISAGTTYDGTAVAKGVIGIRF